MAFVFSPKYIQQISMEGLSPGQFLALTIEAAENLGWNTGSKNENGFVAYTPFSMSSWSELVTVTVENDADLALAPDKFLNAGTTLASYSSFDISPLALMPINFPTTHW